jgi:dTDP-4-dehydrorhamnose reductase
MAQVLVFGKNGQVGSSLLELVSELGHDGILPGGYLAEDWVFVGRDEGNFEKPETILKILEAHQPRVVINSAAYTAVDKAETEQDLAMVINGKTPGAIARWCETNRASLVHFSTDYVYPGTGEQPWLETDPTEPLSIYGVSKLEGDHQILASGCHHVILRTSWVYCASGTNFIHSMLKLGADREELKVVNDQIGSPTSAMNLAKAVLEIIDHPGFRDQELGGIYNIADEGFTSRFEFAKEIFERARDLGLKIKVKNVVPISTDSYPTPAKRPLNSRLDQDKIWRDFAWQSPAWQDALEEVLEEIAVRNIR